MKIKWSFQPFKEIMTDRPTNRPTDRSDHREVSLLFAVYVMWTSPKECGLNTLIHYKKHYLKLNKTSLVNNVWRETWIMTQKTAAQNAVSLWGNQTIKGSPSKFSSILLNLNINNQYKLFFLFNLLQVFLLYYSPIIY